MKSMIMRIKINSVKIKIKMKVMIFLKISQTRSQNKRLALFNNIKNSKQIVQTRN
jgi:hypothetical protein